MESLKEKTAKGLFWGGMSVGMQQLLGLLFGIIFGRLLSPSEYGMVAMISVFSLVANELQNSGFKSALVNIKQPEHRHYNAVFWFNIFMGLLLYLLLFACAPLIADFYHEPQLIPLCRYAFLGFVFSGWGTAQQAYLFKNLRAKQQAKASLTATVISSTIGVVMAWQGCSYWALATQTNLFILINTLLSWHYSPWRPGRPADFTPIRDMIGYSYKLVVSTVLNALNSNILNILLGKFYGGRAAGSYNQAYQWHTKAYYVLQGMVQQVSQPVMVGVGDDAERRLRVLRKLIRFTAFFSFPLLLGFAIVSEEFILITIKEQWIESAYLLRILCVSGAFMPLVTVISNTLLSRGRSDLYLYCNAAMAGVQIVMMVMLYPFGIRTMVLAYCVISIAYTFVWQLLSQHIVGYKLWLFLKDIMPFFLVAAATMLLTHVLTGQIVEYIFPINSGQLHHQTTVLSYPYAALWVLLISRMLLSASLYFIIMKVCRVKILDECISYFRRRKG